MRSPVVLVLGLALQGIASYSVSIKPVVKTSSPATYNRWLHAHRAEYPNLWPVHIWIDTVIERRWGRHDRNADIEYRVSFYDDFGNRETRVFSGTQLAEGWELPKSGYHVTLTPRRNRLLVDAYTDWSNPDSATTMVLEESGEPLFVSRGAPLMTLDGAFYCRSRVDDDRGKRGHFALYDAQGHLLRTIHYPGAPWPHALSRDTICVARLSRVWPERVIAFDKQGTTLWDAPANVVYVAISENGRMAAAICVDVGGADDSVVTYDLQSGESSTIKFAPSQGKGRQAPKAAAFSPGSDTVAVCRQYNISSAGSTRWPVTVHFYAADGSPAGDSVEFLASTVRSIHLWRDVCVVVGHGDATVIGRDRSTTNTDIGESADDVFFVDGALLVIGRKSVSVYRVELPQNE